MLCTSRAGSSPSSLGVPPARVRSSLGLDSARVRSSLLAARGSWRLEGLGGPPSLCRHRCCAPSATSHGTRENIYRCSRYIASGNKSTVFIFKWRVFNFCLVVSKGKGNMQRHPDRSGLESGGPSSQLVNNTTRTGSSRLESLGGSSPLDSARVSWRLESARVQVWTRLVNNTSRRFIV